VELDDLIVHKSEYEADTVLEAWRPHIGDRVAVLLPTRLGHVFLERDDGEISFLDTWSGDLQRVCASYEEFRSRMPHDAELVDRWLMPDLVASLQEAGLKAARGECYSPYVSPGVGGSLSPSNFLEMSLRVHLATSAAEHRAIHGW
jgi:type VI secretion system (T6SS) immunity protein Tdi1